MTQILPIVIDALAKTLLYGPLCGFVGYLYSVCWLLILASCPSGQAALRATFSKRELRDLLPRPVIVPAPKSSNVVPFRPRREHMAPIEEVMEAAE